MLTFNTLEFITLISHIFWPMVRILSFFSVTPIFHNKSFNKKNKILLSGIISWLVYPFLPEVHVILFSFFGLLLFLQQILIGIILGFVVQFLFVAINLSGEVISLQMGLSFAAIFNSNMHIGNSIISRLLNILTLLFFLILNAHLHFLAILINSFYTFPIDSYLLNTEIFLVLLKFSSYFFLSGMIFVLPVLIILLMISFIMSFLNRFSPQISIFSIGFPLNLLVGILMLYFLIPNILPFFENLLHDLILFITDTLLMM
ncbi:flagellar biosynthetic protein FliR [Buchnera aphidicola (Macrosiphoniella sanborni)]|uniref:Flagellar biosynthetic protein FliR n=1 Tax=Buchnera aphidicola (Macrosiphoniella sanborni) TaxID=1241865 RepID=A0A4D6YB27_9GAMM|nr:flagellar biosynthetic protein FliR [Buchnera aphidicola]QCI23651.1 flagellar biosynthetic protein FliR [Buchnera aphidicola (Macrosiphoniella sanborni)]